MSDVDELNIPEEDLDSAAGGGYAGDEIWYKCSCGARYSSKDAAACAKHTGEGHKREKTVQWYTPMI